MRPAINAGLSVSRVGGAAQSKAMKKAAGSIRIDLAQARELESFTQFSSDLDDVTKAQLHYGQTITELLKQPLCHPLSQWQQIVILTIVNKKILQDIEISKIKQFTNELLHHFETVHSDTIGKITTSKEMNDSLSREIVEISEKFKERFK
jgi:F-type H+-transporting ATPase subunit alpha